MTLDGTAETTGRACIFCGGRPLTREHLLPAWLAGVLPSDDPVIQFRTVGPGEGDHREWSRRPFRQNTRFVCERCNSGWMSRLEETSRPVLAPAIRREPCIFDQEQQGVAAAWAFKTCLVLQATQSEGPPLAPPFHFLHVRRSRTPPPQVAVWIGSHYRSLRDPVNSAYVQSPVALSPLDDRLPEDSAFGYLCFLAVGGISFVVIGHRYRNRAELRYEGILTDAIEQVWPDPRPTLQWPPRYMMDRDLVDVITHPPGGFTIRVWPAWPGADTGPDHP